MSPANVGTRAAGSGKLPILMGLRAPAVVLLRVVVVVVRRGELHKG